MKFIAFVEKADQIKKILAHVGLPTESPKVHPARGQLQSDLWETAQVAQWEVDATYPEAIDQNQSQHRQQIVHT
jgi:hypothetical protein